MRHPPSPALPAVAPSSAEGAISGRPFDLSELVRILRRHRATLALCLGLSLLLATAYVLTAPSLYTATTRMMIDTRRAQVFSPQQSVVSGDTFDAASVESQLEVLRSENLARSVIRDLDLLDDQTFIENMCEKPD